MKHCICRYKWYIVHFYLFILFILKLLISYFILANSYHCPGTVNTCIPVKWQCDGENDCPNGIDEINCKIANCDTWQFEV